MKLVQKNKTLILYPLQEKNKNKKTGYIYPHNLFREGIIEKHFRQVSWLTGLEFIPLLKLPSHLPQSPG